jgi:hypothetical protein
MRLLKAGLCVVLALMVLPVGAAAAGNLKGTSTGTISGTVTNVATHQAVEGVGVTVYQESDGDWQYFDSRSTGESGDYSFNLDPGTYRASAKAEFSPETFSNGATAVDGAQDVVVTDGGSQTVDIAIPVTEQDGSIVGRVTHGASPLANINVHIFLNDDDADFNATTGSDGSYALTDLPEGSYKAVFSDQAGTYAAQWNGGELWQDRAATITVGANPVTCDADLGLAGALHGSLSVTPTLGGTEPYGQGNCDLTVFRQDGATWTAMDPNVVAPSYNAIDTDGDGEWDQQDGTYTVSGMPAGTYRVRFGGVDVCGRFYPSAAATDPADPACTSIVVQPGSDQDLGTAHLVRAGRIAIKVTDPWGGPTDVGIDVLRATNNPDPWETAWVRHSWTEGSTSVTIGGLLNGYSSCVPTSSTGDYRVCLDGGDGSPWKAQWFSGKSSYATASSVHVVDGQTTTISMTLKFVLPFSTLNTPSAPSSVHHGRAFTVSGTVKPRQKSGSKAVTLYFYRSESGHWKLRKTMALKVSNYKSYSRYSTRLSLSLKGKWRMRAYHVDGTHAPTYSGWRGFSVK